MAELNFSELFSVWTSIWISDTARYLIAAGILALLLLLLRRRLESRRIQSRRASGSDIRREVTFSLLSAAIFSLVGFGVYVGSEYGVFRLDTATSPTLSQALIDFAVIAVFHDAYFYWMHRAMHHPRLFRVFHRLHHLSRTPTPWTAYAFAPAEAFVEAVFLPLFLLFYPTTGVVAFLFTSHMILRNVVGHAGIELFPKKWLHWPILRAITTTTHHDLHHAEYRWNYGLYFTWWDRLMGTEHPEYRERFACTTNSRLAPDQSHLARTLTMVTLTMVTAFAAVHAYAEESVAGRWVTPGFGAIVEVDTTSREDERQKLRGKVIWVLDETHQDAVGANLFQHMLGDADGWSGGRIFNPENGRHYRGSVQLATDGSLSVSGCIGPFCQNQRWRRFDDILATMPDRHATVCGAESMPTAGVIP
jgi:sterol desaturase/sphingolipid hydroxylase (fatty acid hydroxylase superfamily)